MKPLEAKLGSAQFADISILATVKLVHHHIGYFVIFLTVELYDKILTQFHNNYKANAKPPVCKIIDINKPYQAACTVHFVSHVLPPLPDLPTQNFSSH